MKTKVLICLMLISTFTLLFTVSCKKQQPRMLSPHNNCEGMHATTADFLMEEICHKWDDKNFWIETETDTVYSDHPVQFTAIEQKAKYKWYINGEEYHTKNVRLLFGEEMTGQTIFVTLVVKKDPDNICFPNDNGYDSITKTLHISHKTPGWIDNYANYDWAGTLKTEGVYRVFAPHLNDSIDITFTTDYDIYTGDYWKKTAALLNIDGNNAFILCESISDFKQTAINYHGIKALGHIQWSPSYFSVRIDTKKVAYISIKMKQFSLENPDYEYVGRKL